MVKSRIANLADVYNFITSPQFTEDQKLQQMINSEHNSDGAEDLFYNIYNDVTILQEKNYLEHILQFQKLEQKWQIELIKKDQEL